MWAFRRLVASALISCKDARCTTTLDSFVRPLHARTIRNGTTPTISAGVRQGGGARKIGEGRRLLSANSGLFRRRFGQARGSAGQQTRLFSHSARSQQYGRRQPFNYQTFKGTQNLVYRWAARPTFYYEVGGLTLVCVGIYVVNLEHVPVSNRYRFNIVSAEWEKQLGQSMYKQTMQEFGPKIMPDYSYEHRMVRKVLERLVPHSGLAGEEWEVHVIDDQMKNAFVIPGGKVFVFRGIMDVAKGEDGLAAVLGHEIAHNVAHHAAERTSQNWVLMIPAMIGLSVFGFDPSIGNALVNLAFTLPGSRTQEAEADYIGLMMMADSCYDPSAAMGLWAAMEKEEKGAPPQFLSTHPSSHSRLEKIREWLPKAEDRREQSGCGMIGGYSDAFKKQMGYPTTSW